MSEEWPTKAVSVDPGVCRFKARISSYKRGGKVRCRIESDCPCVQQLAEEIGDIDAFDALSMPYEDNPVFSKAGRILKHSTCPIPTAILKCIEATAGLAIARDVTIEFE